MLKQSSNKLISYKRIRLAAELATVATCYWFVSRLKMKIASWNALHQWFSILAFTKLRMLHRHVLSAFLQINLKVQRIQQTHTKLSSWHVSCNPLVCMIMGFNGQYWWMILHKLWVGCRGEREISGWGHHSIDEIENFTQQCIVWIFKNQFKSS